jgi:cytochrome c oxidase subunit II
MKSRILKILPMFALALLAGVSYARHDDASSPKIIELKAKRFTFTPGEITLKKDEPVVLRLSTEDVTHGLSLEQLQIDATIEPGKISDVAITPRQTGKFVAACNHFCGAGHRNMRLAINVVE